MADSMATPGRLPRKARAVALRAWKVLRNNWHLGVTAFGGPPVHFKIVSAGAHLPERLRR